VELYNVNKVISLLDYIVEGLLLNNLLVIDIDRFLILMLSSLLSLKF